MNKLFDVNDQVSIYAAGINRYRVLFTEKESTQLNNVTFLARTEKWADMAGWAFIFELGHVHQHNHRLDPGAKEENLEKARKEFKENMFGMLIQFNDGP